MIRHAGWLLLDYNENAKQERKTSSMNDEKYENHLRHNILRHFPKKKKIIIRIWKSRTDRTRKTINEKGREKDSVFYTPTHKEKV